MSVQTQILRIAADRDTIRTKLVDFGLVETTANLDDCATAVDGIVNNGGVTATVKEGTSYTIPAGYHDGSGVVSGIAGGGNYTLQSKTVTPSKTQLSVTAADGYYGLSDVVVNAIPAAYQDVTAVTAAAGDVLATKVFVDSTGKVTTGTMPNRGTVTLVLDVNTTSYTIAAGYHNGSGKVSIVTETKTATPTTTTQLITPTSGKVLSQVTVNPIPAVYADVTDATATAAGILYGQTAYVGGVAADGVTPKAEKITGTMPNNGATGATLNGTTTSYTIPAGYTTGGTVSISTETKTATPKTSDQTITPSTGKVLTGVTVKGVTVSLPAAGEILKGKVASVTSNGTTLGSVTGTIESKAAATYNPSTTAQTIAAGQYLSGAQTIAAVTTSGISAANIKHGQTINVGYAGTGNAGKIATATGTFYNDGTTYSLTAFPTEGNTIDMGATSSNRYIEVDTSKLQTIPTATYTATGAVTSADITSYGKLTIASGSVTPNAATLTGTTTKTFTLGTVSATAGWVTAGTKVSGATFANSATSGQTYLDISDTTAAPVLVSGNYLYINKGYTDNVKISLAKLVPDGASASLAATSILSGFSAYNNDGTLIAGSIPTLSISGNVIHPSTSDQTIAKASYTGASDITVHKVTTANISAANIKSGVVVKVGDADDDDRITAVTGTFTNETASPIAAATVLSGKVGYVNGAKVTGTMANKGAANISFNALTETSKTIPAGYYNGSGSVVLTDDLEEALAAI